MSRLHVLGPASVLAVVACAAAVTSPVARADVPGPGDSCTVLHATTHDATGRMMWCNPTMTGAHSLVWQYGGPS